MPIWLRTFTFNKIQEYYKNQKKEIEEANESKIERLTPTKNKHTINPPDYIVKASK